MANSLKIRTLGGLSIRRDGDIVDGFASRKAELLLVYLACNPRVHRREVPAELLWDDRSQQRAMANLRVVLSSLRGEGFPAVTIYWLDLPSSPQQCRWLAEQWRSHLGVTVDWQLLPISEAPMMYRGKRGALSSVGWVPDYPDPDNFLRVAWRLHQPFWPSERYLRLVEEARQLKDQARRLALYQEADRILVESAHMVPLAYEGTLLLIKPWVRGYRSAATEGALWKNVIIEPH